MKNLMKKQLKKSLSLFLAVLMMLSCWVWVAPTEASAVASRYYYKLVMNNVNSAEITGEDFRIYYKPNNGTGTETNTGNIFSNCGSDAGNNEGTFTWKGYCDGFPTKLYFRFGDFYWPTGKVRYENICLYIGSTQAIADAETYKIVDNQQFEKSGDGATMEISVSGEAPKLNAATATLTPATHTLAKINTGTASTSTITLGGFVDQYGVEWASITPSFTLRADGDVTLGDGTASMSGSGNSRTITIKPWFQTLYPGKQSAKLYIDWGVNNKTKSGTETINITFPTYKATFHANGGQIGADDTEAKDTIEYTGEKMNIGSVIGKAPAYAAKPGFVFKGFYSTLNADATGLTASFSGTKFVDNETTIPAATSGNGDTNWYAAWQASPITATFVTQDGQLIGTVEGRYNNYMTALNMYNGDAGLNAAVKAAYTGNSIQFDSSNAPVYTDGATTYTFAGWKIIKAYNESVVDGNEDTILHGDVTFQAVYTKATAATYTVSFEDGNGTVISTQSGYKYRDDVTNIPANDPTKAQDDRYDYEFIGWAKDIGKNLYVVDEYDNDENGAKIVYTHKDGAEFIVKGDASYVPVFRMVPREYSVTFNYTVDGGTTESVTVDGYHWGDTPVMPEIKDNYTDGGYRNYLVGWKSGTDSQVKQLDEIAVEGNMYLTAVYGNAEAAEYTINFLDKDGNLINNGENENQYTHNSEVTVPTVGDGEGYDIPQTIDTEDSLYTFKEWSPAVNTTATSDATYQAIYTKDDYADVHFYNYDGTLIYETAGKDNSLFVGETIPAYTGETPVKEEDVVGTYTFTGWADGSGNEVLPGTDKFTGDTFLYAQFETVYKEYTVKFENEGEVISELKYHYGDEITVPADPTKAADVEYIYDFRAWSPDVSEVCYGDATYEATYMRTYQYYEVTWLNDKKAIHTESNYTYNAKIQQAVINDPVDYPDAAEGKTWAFKHWVQCDENGNDILVDGQQIIFSRGQRMPAEHLYFYPVFEEVDRIHTVKFYKEDGTTLLGEAKIPYGKLIADYADAFAEKAPKLSDDTYHYIINDWVNVNGGAAVTTVTADVSVKATYTAEPHSKQIYEVIAEPTCNVPGYAHYKCDVPQCTDIDYNVAIAPIADEGAPTGQIYVGTNKWTLENFTAGINYDDIKYVGPDTYLVVNAEDTGSRSMPWNLEGKLSRGVGKIEYYISKTKLDEPSNIGSWTTVYDYEAFRTDALNEVLAENKITLLEYNGYNHGSAEDRMKKAEIDREVDARLSVYNANATGVVSNLNLIDGEEYIIYIKVSDREGNGEVNTCYFSSGTISYGKTSAEIAISGEGYGTKFCADATVAVTDDTDGFKVYLDGEEVTLTNGKFTCEEAGVHTVTVIDKHGNKTTKTFEIKGNHTYRNYTTAANCVNAGARYDLCTVCGHKANEVVIPALGHSYTANFIDKAPDCINDGYRTYVCDNNCGTKLILKPTDDADTLAQAKKYVEPVEGEEEGTWVALTADDLKELKATGIHTYAKVKDEAGKDTEEDAWTIDKAATCSVPGSKHKDCTKCGETVTEEIPVDTVNGHKFYREKVTLEPTCTEKGAKTKTCRYCGEVVKTGDIDALGHVAGEYKVIIEPTCEDKGSKILTCKVCGEVIGEPVKDKDGEFSGEAVEIPALGHAWKIDGEVYSAEETDVETGETITVWYQNYVCNNDSKHTKKEKLEDYKPPVAATVTFDFNGGYYVIPAVGNPDETDYEPELKKDTQTISTFVGESIIATDIKTAFKQDTATCKYTFSHWATKNDDGTYTEVKFPIEVKGDATYYAVYAEKYINYTITYYAEDGTTEIGKTGYLHSGDTVTLAAGPAKAETTYKTYEFAGWALTTDATKVYAETIKIDGSNINLKATYTEKDRYYAVTYAYDADNILETFLVKAGTPARDCFETPTKAYDSINHYTFKAWDKAEQLKSVTSNIYTTPTFTAEQHIMGETVKTPATCTENEVKLYVCKDEACEYSYEREIANSALGHNWVYNEEEDIFECSREGCDETTTKTDTTYTITYYNAVDKIYTHSYGVNHGAILNGILPEGPSKAADKEKTYTFKHWATKDDEGNVTKLPDNYEVKSDLKLYPVYDGETRTYTVVYAYNAGAYIGEEKVTAGQAAENEYTAEDITKESDSKYHYTFDGWNKAEELAKVYSDIYTTPNFTHEEHKFTATVKTPATCTTDRIDTYACTCGYNYAKTIPGTALGHEWGDPKTGENGETIRECTRCDATTTEGITHSIVYYNAKGEVYTRAYNIAHGTALKNVLPVNGPSKAADQEYTYTFKGWATKDAEGNLVPVAEDAKVTSKLDLYPLYDKATREYTVKFLNATGDVVYETTVEAGAEATCPDENLPTKKADDKYHYTFKAWNKPAELAEVYSDIVTSPEFTSAEHTMTGRVTTEATCQIKEVTTYTCSGCDYSYTKEGSLGTHNWGEPVTENGVTTTKCTNAGCEEKLVDTAVYTVEYYADKDAAEALSTKTVEHGTKFADISVATPTKAKDDYNTYEFSHWALKSDSTEAAIDNDATVTSAMEVVAVYKATARLYTVIFGYDAEKTIVSYSGKTFAEISPALYNEKVEGTPEKKYNNNEHFVYSGFEFAKTDEANNAYIYYAQFNAVAHTMAPVAGGTVSATCTEGASILEKCQFCEYENRHEQGRPLGHKEVLDEEKSTPAVQGKDGENVYKCSRCGIELRRETTKWQNPEAGYVTIKVRVKDLSGNAIQGAKVELYSGSNRVDGKYTDAQGYVTFTVPKGEYTAIISDVKNADAVQFTVNANQNGEIQNVPQVAIRHCGCACHRTNIWGAIFRFFHRIIKMITGEFKCCSDPSNY